MPIWNVAKQAAWTMSRRTAHQHDDKDAHDVPGHESAERAVFLLIQRHARVHLSEHSVVYTHKV